MSAEDLNSGPIDRQCRVHRRIDHPGDTWRLEVEWPELARIAEPATFAMLRCSEDGSGPLLRRPFSIADVDEAEGTIAFLGKRIGPGTRALGELDAGDTLRVIGPLGRGFSWEPGSGATHVMIAGGIGIAPFPLLARQLAAAGEHAVLLFGGRTKDDLTDSAWFAGQGIDVRTIVQEGDETRLGLVTDLLSELVEDSGDASSLRAYSCGPTPMLKAVGSQLLQAGVPHQTALEEYMGCGFGVCIGCAVPVNAAGGEIEYERCCVEGPVFDYARLAWQGNA